MDFEPGDVIAFRGRGFQSRVIELATFGYVHKAPSHVGIVCDHGNDLVIVESTTMCPLPCEILGKQFDGVQAHAIEPRLRSYDGRAERLSLRPAWRLTPSERALMSHVLIGQWVGLKYDLEGAISSGTRCFKYTGLQRLPDPGSLFCSQLVASILMRVGRMAIDDPSDYNPASLVRHLLKTAVYCRAEKIRTGAAVKLYAA